MLQNPSFLIVKSWIINFEAFYIYIFKIPKYSIFSPFFRLEIKICQKVDIGPLEFILRKIVTCFD